MATHSSILENSIDFIAHGVANSWTRLSLSQRLYIPQGKAENNLLFPIQQDDIKGSPRTTDLP